MQFSLNFQLSAWFVLLCVAIAFFFAFLLYFRDKKLSHISKKIRQLLFYLRFISVFLITLLLLSPLFKKNTQIIEKPIIALLVDNSQSVVSTNFFDKNFKDKFQNIINSLSDNYKVLAYSFDSNLYDTVNFSFNGQQTNIGFAIEQLANRLYNKNVGAFVLFSDGIFNAGPNPAISVENFLFPFYTVGLGDTSLNEDLFVKSVQYNKIAYLNTEIPIYITVAAKKLITKTAILNVFDKKNNLLYTQNIQISSNNFIHKTILYVNIKEIGIEEYSIKLNIFEQEKNKINNSTKIAVEVKQNKQKILILANSPHPDIASISRSLQTNLNNEVDVLFIDDFQTLNKNYSLVVLYQLPSENIAFDNVYQQIQNKKIPLLFVCGTQTDYKKINALNIGFKVDRAKSDFDFAYSYKNLNFDDFQINKEFSEILLQAPPLMTLFANITLSANTKALFYQRLKEVNTQKPLIIVNSTNKYRIGTILGENFWRWRMFIHQNKRETKLFDDFFNNFAQYLIASGNKNRFLVKTDRIISSFDDVVFFAEAYNEAMELTNQNDVELTITDSLKKTYKYVFQKTANAYWLNIGKLPVGQYSYSAKTIIADKQFNANGNINIIKTEIETQNLTADFDLLKDISQSTGGQFINYSQIDSLKNIIENSNKIKPKLHETINLTDITSQKLIFFLILFILSLEWLLRKIFGTY